MWSVSYDKAVRNYIYDSFPYTDRVWQAIKSLRHLEGVPDSGAYRTEPNVFVWLVERHIVVYRRMEEEKRIHVRLLKPVE